MMLVLTPEEARNIVYDENEKAEKVLDEITDTGRWSVYYRLVFKQDGKLYETAYSRGATEYQDEGPFANDDEVECYEVEEYQKTVTDYRKVEVNG